MRGGAGPTRQGALEAAPASTGQTLELKTAQSCREHILAITNTEEPAMFRSIEYGFCGRKHYDTVGDISGQAGCIGPIAELVLGMYKVEIDLPAREICCVQYRNLTPIGYPASRLGRISLSSMMRTSRPKIHDRPVEICATISAISTSHVAVVPVPGTARSPPQGHLMSTDVQVRKVNKDINAFPMHSNSYIFQHLKQVASSLFLPAGLHVPSVPSHSWSWRTVGGKSTCQQQILVTRQGMQSRRTGPRGVGLGGWVPKGGGIFHIAYLVHLVIAEVLAVGDVLAAHGVVHVGLDAAGGDGVDGDLLVTAVDGHAADEGLDRALGARVDGVLGHALGLAGDGAHEDDAAADGKVLVGLAGDEELAAGVDAEDAVELLLGHVLQVAERHDAGVGADDVQLAEVLDGLGHELGGLGDVADVGLEGNGVAAFGLDALDDLVGGVGRVGVVDDDLGAAAGELGGHGRTDATAGTGDEGDLAIKAGGLDSLRGRHGGWGWYEPPPPLAAPAAQSTRTTGPVLGVWTEPARPKPSNADLSRAIRPERLQLHFSRRSKINTHGHQL
nr:hypothetical protein CFP56_64839 [Quercus suber]